MPEPEARTLDSLETLRLDPLNPRLRKDEENKDESDLIEIMVTRFKVEEVAESIISAGWLSQDPLIAVEEDGEMRVVEGNRRLTAVKLLLKPDLAPEKRRTRWRTLAGALSPEVREQIGQLSVWVYKDRDDPAVSSYIGFRHVTGVLPWPAMEKASYIARLASRGMSYKALAEKLGSYPSHVKRHHVAFQLVEQAEEWELDGAQQMGEAFGVLLRALQTEGVNTFLSLNTGEDPKMNVRPVANGKREDFEKFIAWTFGTATKKRILPESRELTNWSKILLSTPAIQYLRVTEAPRFEKAWSLSGGESTSIADALWKASFLLADVIPILPDHRTEPQLRDAAIACDRFMRQINSILIDSGERQGD